MFCSVLFCSVLFCSVLFCSVLFCSVLFCSVLFRFFLLLLLLLIFMSLIARVTDAILHGVETRTSAPVQITRKSDTLECTTLAGLYPTGEGAGYAGGIVVRAVHLLFYLFLLYTLVFFPFYTLFLFLPYSLFLTLSFTPSSSSFPTPYSPLFLLHHSPLHSYHLNISLFFSSFLPLNVHDSPCYCNLFCFISFYLVQLFNSISNLFDAI